MLHNTVPAPCLFYNTLIHAQAEESQKHANISPAITYLLATDGRKKTEKEITFDA